jgi:hypothetical protein
MKRTVKYFDNARVTYAEKGVAIETRAKSDGWECHWKMLAEQNRPDWWERNGEQRPAFSAGRDAWLDPDGKLIATLAWPFARKT